MPVIEEIQIKNSKRLGNDCEITMRGTPENLMRVLVEGMPREGLEQLKDALEAEMVKRAEQR
jgi:hypothetical protein